ncbi:MAG: glycoside hydrolase family 88 protein [Lachnospiraceae bacterium]|nr:glycoside hydrolase family 88 protein [Lachnospiraceae bacterium]
MNNEIKEKSITMVEEAIFQLNKYSRYRFKDNLLRFLKRMAGRKLPPKDRINWPTALLANALMAYYKNNLNLEISLVIKHALIKYYQRYIKSRQKFLYLDNALSGLCLIDLHQTTKDERFKEMLDELAVYLKRHSVDSNGSLPYRQNQHNLHIYADGIGMICPFLCKYGYTYGDEAAINLAVKQIQNFCRNGMDGRTGLPYHGFDFKSQTKHGIIGWGRALGWLMMGMVDSLVYLDKANPNYDEIKQNFRRLVDKVEAYQREDGYYPWQLPAREGPFDTSATAMILYAIARGLENDILIGIHRSRLLKGRDALAKAVTDGNVINCLAECGGFGIYPQKYDAFPWSLGPALSLFAINLKEMEG